MRDTAARRLLTIVTASLLCATSAACGSDAAKSADQAPVSARAQTEAAPSSRRSGDVKVLGKITATVDGKTRTWFAVAGQAKTGRYASAGWSGRDDGTRTVSIGGLDSENPPVATFENDVQAGQVSFGDYHGSTIMLLFTAPAGSETLKVDLERPEGPASLAYMPVATPDLAGVYMVGPGSLEITRLSFDGGMARVEGRFEGTLRTTSGGAPVSIQNGRFEISSIPALDELGQ